MADLIFLADAAAATRDEVAMVFAAIVAIAGGAVVLRKLFVRQPPIEAEFVSKEEFREYSREVTRSFEKLGEKIDDLKRETSNAGERRAIAIHERINAIDRAVAGITAVLERTK